MNHKLFLDINCDVGEAINNEENLFPHISSCNIACGGHAGNKKEMKKIVLLAQKFGLNIGAHPSYPDKENFGRKKIQISDNSLRDSIENQIMQLVEILDEEDLELNHIKAHGALYNFSANDRNTAVLILEIAKKFNVKLYVPYNSLISKLADGIGVEIMTELFLDRKYNDDYSLLDRNHKNAIITKTKDIICQLENILNNKIITVNNKVKKVKYETLCIHGDNVNANEILENLTTHFKSKGIEIKKY